MQFSHTSFFLKIFLLACIIVLPGGIKAQEVVDSTNEIELNEVVVRAFEKNSRLQDVPAAVSVVTKNFLERFGSASIVSAVNITPGVRMEERSPGSYRFNIRGSSLRSPFGVRNVKVYFNDLPYTDPGGLTYLNQLGYYNFTSIEIIKGPGNSLYGAGTGGVLLIEGLNAFEDKGVFAEYSTGSFGMQNIYGSVTTGKEKNINKIGFQHQQNNGYRNHSELKRDVFTWLGNYFFNDNKNLKTTFLYGDLFYKTPGALTIAEFNTNPKMARPGNTFFPGSEEARAAIYQKTFLAGASYEQRLTDKLKNKTSLYGAFTQLRNPTLRNYGRTSEPHTGGRTVFNFLQPLAAGTFTLDAGAELQQGFASFSIHKNNNGNADSIQTYDEVSNKQSFIFLQAALNINTWTITVSSSFNSLKVKIQQFTPTPIPEQTTKFSEIAPRFSIMKTFKNLSVYSSVAKGFSPPATSELLPTGGLININLEAEDGINYDVGTRGRIRKLVFDVNAFVFHLNNTIVQRRDAGGGDFFINAGKTKQIGIETSLQYPLFKGNLFINRGNFWLSHTWHHFKYLEFTQVNNNYSGKKIPGVAPHIISSGFDIVANNGLIAAVSYYYSDALFLTDVNNEMAPSYHLVSAKIGYEKLMKKIKMKISVGADNLLNEKYSLGNDINGFGGRYYNAAPTRNYFASFIFQWIR